MSPLPKALATLIATGSLAASATLSQAATASSGALGYTTINCLWNSDTLCSPAGITEKPEYVGNLEAVPVGAMIQVSGAPGWADDAFNGTHYVRFRTGSKAGRYFAVTDTLEGDKLTLDLDGDNLTGVLATDTVKLVKFWTLGTLFPIATQDTIIESAGNLGFQRETEVLFPDLSTEGINLSSPRKFFLVTASGWRESTSVPAYGAADDVIILPDMYFIVRQPDAPVGTPVGVLGTGFVPMGTVEEGPTTIVLSSRDKDAPGGALGSQDNSVAMARPVSVALKDSDLISSGAFMPSANNLGFNRRDELFVFDLDVDVNTPADEGINRASINKYYYSTAAGTWIDKDGSNADDELIFQPGTGVIIRKYNTSGGVTSFWEFDISD